MQSKSGKQRTDAGERLVRAKPLAVYRVFLDPDAVALWRPPEGMECRIYEFDPREGGCFRMAFHYKDHSHEVRGKTGEHEDVFNGKFLRLIPGKRIVEQIEFETDDTAFQGPMIVTTTFASEAGGTRVGIACTQVPEGINAADHRKGIASTLKNLAAFVE